MRGHTWGTGLVVVGLVALGSAAVGYEHRGYRTPTDAGIVPPVALTSDWRRPVAEPPIPRVQKPRPGVRAISTERPRPPSLPGNPVRLTIASIGVSASVIRVGVHGGAWDVPEDPQVLGWWSKGGRPGTNTGSTVIVGHVDSAVRGPGALYHLESTAVGSLVSVETDSGLVRYRVVGRRVYAKSALPSDIFATGGTPRLVLITCGGPFDRRIRHYKDNVVVYAVPA